MITVLKKLFETSGTWNIDLPETSATIAITKGKVTVEGETAEVFASTNPKFPTSAGWFTIVQADGQVAVARKTETAEKLELVVIQGDVELAATVKAKESGTEKEGEGKPGTDGKPGPEPQIPKGGKYFQLS